MCKILKSDQWNIENIYNQTFTNESNFSCKYSKVFTNGPGDPGSIPGRVIPKTQKMELDASLFNTQHYKVRIKGKEEQSRERNSALLYTLV